MSTPIWLRLAECGHNLAHASQKCTNEEEGVAQLNFAGGSFWFVRIGENNDEISTDSS
jgi:hypothetical protein